MAVLEHVKGDRWRVRVHDPARGRYRSRTFTANGKRAAERKRNTIAGHIMDASATDGSFGDDT